MAYKKAVLLAGDVVDAAVDAAAAAGLAYVVENHAGRAEGERDWAPGAEVPLIQGPSPASRGLVESVLIQQ